MYTSQSTPLVMKGGARTSLMGRLERLDDGLPTDGRSAAYAVAAMRQLLDTPLDVLCDQDGDALEELMMGLVNAKHTLGLSDQPPPVTYQDALLVVWRLRPMTTGPRSAAHRQAETILTLLARQLLRPHLPTAPEPDGQLPGLAERLAALPPEALRPPGFLISVGKLHWELKHTVRAREFPILTLPLGHYVCACARLTGDSRPIDLYRKHRLAGEDLMRFKPFERYLAFMLKWVLDGRSWPDRERYDSFDLLYTMLVEPVFPSVEAGRRAERFI